jgi:uncharacterized protein (TIGR03083 family)
MEPEAFLGALVSEGDTFISVAAENLDGPVPACPDWDVAALVGHLGRVYSWVRLSVAGGGERPSQPRAEPPAERDEIMAWFEQIRGGLLEDFRSHSPDDPAWVFVPTAPQNVAWWLKRQALETAVHRVDAEQAAGSSSPIEPELAVAGIDEFLGQFLTGVMSQRPVEGLHGTFHVHATDAAGEWWMDLDSREPPRLEHAKADTAVRGPASGLYLWLWNRLTPEQAGLEVFGDASVVEAWPGLRI